MHRRDLVVEDRTFAVLDVLIDDAFCLCGIITNADGQPVDYRLLRVNRHFEAMTGLADAEGRTGLELVPDLEPKWAETYGRVALGGETLSFEDDAPSMGRIFEVHAVPVEPHGCFALRFRDITHLRRLEAEREQALRNAEALLAELNHRVMNSFASMAAIVAMEARAASPEGRAALDRLHGRVQALGELYRRLDGATRIDLVDMGDYLDGVIQAFRGSLGAGLAIESDIASLSLPTRKALPLALVANELLTDVARRAGGAGATIRVTLARDGGHCALVVADDAGPADDGAPRPAEEARRDVGRNLVRAFVAELGARLDLADDRGGRRALVEVPLA